MVSDPIPDAVLAAACDEARAYLRIEGAGEDAVLKQAAGAAIGLFEQFACVALIVRGHRQRLPVSSRWQRLAPGPVVEIEQVTGVPADGGGFALPVAHYAIDLDAAGDGWVRVVHPGAAGRIEVAFRAGQASGWSDVPEPVRQGAVLMIAYLYRDRAADDAPPAAVGALWRPWRRMRIGGDAR